MWGGKGKEEMRHSLLQEPPASGLYSAHKSQFFLPPLLREGRGKRKNEAGREGGRRIEKCPQACPPTRGAGAAGGASVVAVAFGPGEGAGSLSSSLFSPSAGGGRRGAFSSSAAAIAAAAGGASVVATFAGDPATSAADSAGRGRGAGTGEQEEEEASFSEAGEEEAGAGEGPLIDFSCGSPSESATAAGAAS